MAAVASTHHRRSQIASPPSRARRFIRGAPSGKTHLRTQLVESAWAYKARPPPGGVLKRRQEGLDPAVVARAWAARLRLCAKFARLDARKTNRKTVVTAIVREIAGFAWAEITAA